MNNSQSPDCFLENTNTSICLPMDTISYESLITNTKQTLSAGIDKRESENITVSMQFTTLLEDCYTCVNQSLDLVKGIISDTEVCIPKLIEYLNDAVSLLQMLSNYIKTIIDSMPMPCCSMKMFPSTTGLIIFNVFSHCKDSELLYGTNIACVEKQLKDLFRNCHELQLTYLMILEKHFIFDLTDMEEKDILIEALDINLKIGEILQSLDVKTMAEQWKAYTMICDKYSATLSETNIFQDCTQILCILIRNNMNTALEHNQDDKLVMRSLKVASFTIKILIKTCNIFRHAKRKDYSCVLNLLFHIQYATSRFHLEATAEKSQYTNLIVAPSECLLKELLSDEVFGNSLLNCEVENCNNEEILVGFLFTITSTMKCLIQGHKNSTVTKSKLINCIYSDRILSHCHIWNLDLGITPVSNQFETLNMLEHLLIHTASMALTLNSEEYSVLEKNMAEAILSTDCCSALFSSNLWELIARHVRQQLLFNQIIWLCTMFKKLENHKMFNKSPQRVHLSYTISRLFEVMESDDKMKICKQFRIHDDDNISLWFALGVNNLPEDVRSAAEEVVVEKLKMQLLSLNNSGDPDTINKLIKVISLAATCTFNNTRGIEDCIMKAWSKTCLRHQFFIQDIDNNTVWFYDYLQALVFLTDSMWYRLAVKRVCLIKVLHSISSLIQHCIEFRLILMNTLCKIATCDISESNLATANFMEAFSSLSQDPEDIVRNKLYITLSQYKNDKNLDRIVSNIEDYWLRQSWSNIKDGQECDVSKDWNAVDVKYTHKCFESRNITELGSSSAVSELKKASSSNFDFANIENLFGNDNDSDIEQPVSKKVKLEEMDETEAIVKRIERDTSLLCKVKENVVLIEYRNRIQNVCDKLKNIIH